jgi:hypothetical protein
MSSHQEEIREAKTDIANAMADFHAAKTANDRDFFY